MELSSRAFGVPEVSLTNDVRVGRRVVARGRHADLLHDVLARTFAKLKCSRDVAGARRNLARDPDQAAPAPAMLHATVFGLRPVRTVPTGRRDGYSGADRSLPIGDGLITKDVGCNDHRAVRQRDFSQAHQLLAACVFGNKTDGDGAIAAARRKVGSSRSRLARMDLDDRRTGLDATSQARW